MEQGGSVMLLILSRWALVMCALLGLVACGADPSDSTLEGSSSQSVRRPQPRVEEAGTAQATMGVMQAALQQRVPLLALADRALAGNAALKEQLDSLLKDSALALQDAAGQAKLIEQLYTLGRYGRGVQEDTGFIEEASVMRVLAAALPAMDETVSNRALTYLLDYGRTDQLALVAAEVRQGLEDRTDQRAARLLALLPQSLDQREELLARLDIGLDVRARLGEPEAETTILNAFRQAQDYSTKRSAAKALGYAATPACIKALLTAMGSSLANRAPYFERSLRCDLIEQLARAVPQEEMFGAEYQSILRQGEDIYGLERTRDYLAKIGAWGSLEHQSPAEFHAKSPLLVRKLIVKRPLKR